MRQPTAATPASASAAASAALRQPLQKTASMLRRYVATNDTTFPVGTIAFCGSSRWRSVAWPATWSQTRGRAPQGKSSRRHDVARRRASPSVSRDTHSTTRAAALRAHARTASSSPSRLGRSSELPRTIKTTRGRATSKGSTSRAPTWCDAQNFL